MTRFVRDPLSLSRRTLEAVVVLPPGCSDAVVVTGVGPAIWALTRDPLSLDELAAALDVPEDELPSVANAVARLVGCGALLEVPGDRPGG
jgi:hypothetical protein